MRIANARNSRGGATTVEFAAVSIILFLFLFGIFEYGRFLFVYHLTTNACRDGARFACVHTNGGTMPGEPATITENDVKEVVRTGMFNGNAYGTGLCGMEGQITGYTCYVYSVSTADFYANNLTPAGKPAWNAAGFHEKIVVRVTGSYQPVIPNLLGLGSTIPFTVTVMMASEAN